MYSTFIESRISQGEKFERDLNIQISSAETESEVREKLAQIEMSIRLGV